MPLSVSSLRWSRSGRRVPCTQPLHAGRSARHHLQLCSQYRYRAYNIRYTLPSSVMLPRAPPWRLRPGRWWCRPAPPPRWTPGPCWRHSTRSDTVTCTAGSRPSSRYVLLMSRWRDATPGWARTTPAVTTPASSTPRTGSAGSARTWSTRTSGQ